MNIKTHKNGWTVFVDQVDVKTLTDQQIEQLRKLITTNLTVIISGQHGLSMEQYQSFIRRIGTPERKKDWFPNRFLVSPEDRDVIRVTGAVNEKGENIGIFNTPDDLSWHCNAPGQQPRPDVLCLYAVEGTVGSITSMSNTSMAYRDLMEEDLSALRAMYMEVPLDNFRKLRSLLPRLSVRYNFLISLDGSSKPSDYKGETGTYPLLHVNKAGLTGLMFSPNQAETILLDGEEMEREQVVELARTLRPLVTAGKYLYDHHWKDGDILLNEQWISLHRRPPFKDIAKRFLYRMMVTL